MTFLGRIFSRTSHEEPESLQQAKDHLNEVEARDTHVNETVHEIRKLQRENNLAARFTSGFRGV